MLCINLSIDITPYIKPLWQVLQWWPLWVIILILLIFGTWILYIVNEAAFRRLYYFPFILVSPIVRLFKFGKKILLGRKIEKELNNSLNIIFQDIKNIEMVPNVKVRWVHGKEISEVPDGYVLVKLSYEDKSMKNIIKAILLYVSSGIIPKARRFIDSKINRGLDYVLATRVIESLPVTSNEKSNAKQMLVTDFYEPEITKDQELQNYTEILESADRQGYVIRICIPTFECISNKFGAGYTFNLKYIKDDTRRLVVEFVKELVSANKIKGVQLSFKGTTVKIGLIFIKRDETDLSVHESWMQHYVRERYDLILILALGKKIQTATEFIESNKIILTNYQSVTIGPYNESMNTEEGLVTMQAICISCRKIK